MQMTATRPASHPRPPQQQLHYNHGRRGWHPARRPHHNPGGRASPAWLCASWTLPSPLPMPTADVHPWRVEQTVASRQAGWAGGGSVGNCAWRPALPPLLRPRDSPEKDQYAATISTITASSTITISTTITSTITATSITSHTSHNTRNTTSTTSISTITATLTTPAY